MENVLIIQARMGSSRLPEKVLKEVCGKPLLQHIVERVGRCKKVDKIIVATTLSEKDVVIRQLCEQLDVECYRGSENDVLDRYYQAALLYEPDNVIRVTADCPLIDAELIDQIITEHEDGGFDYTSNTLVETFPDGLDVEVFKFRALQEAWEKANLASEREHVTPYIKFKGHFIRKSIEREPSLKEKRWTVDTDEDLLVITRIYEALYMEGKYFGTNEILTYLKENEAIEMINSGIVRNEGYQKSVANDYIVEGEI